MNALSNITSGVVIFTGFIVAIFVIRMMSRRRLVRAPQFQGSELTLGVDDAAQELVITREGETEVLRMPLGAVAWRVAEHHVNRPHREGEYLPKTGDATLYLTSFRLPLAFTQDHLTDGLHASYVLKKWTTILSNSEARLAVRWLAHRAQLIAPDVAGHYRTLNAQKKEAAAIMRRHLPEVPVIESDYGRLAENYRYIAVLPSGFVYGAVGMDGMPSPVIRVHAAMGRKISVVFPDRADEFDFELTPTEMHTLQKLQQKGVLSLARQVPRRY